MKWDFIVVGAGFAGAVTARQLANAGKRVLVVEKRSHIAGNAYDEFDEQGVLVHRYGPHIFHTNSERIFEYLSQFTKWRLYEHEVLAKVNDGLFPIPINRETINRMYDLDLDEVGIEDYFEKVRVPIDNIQTSEDVVLNSVGVDLCDKFFRGYTHKQWGLELSELSAGVAARIPTRTNSDCRYFSDKYQYMPIDGYTKMFENILNDKNIEVRLNTDFSESDISKLGAHIVYSGPIDVYFDFCYGKLPYRSLRFEHTHCAGMEKYQDVGTVNFPNDYDYTRITEFKYLTGQKHSGTSIVKEYPMSEGDPYYPIPRSDNELIYKKYVKLAETENNVTFVGRLAQYRYYNMDQVVAAAIKCAEKLLNSSV